MITVSGASGNIGSGLVSRLREMGEEVRALIAPGESAPWQPDNGLEIIEATFDDVDGIERAVRGADAYFLMSPPHKRQVAWQRSQVAAAAKAGVGRVVKLSSYESAADSRWTLGRWHWDGELALRESGLPHAILRPQYFQQNLLRNVAAFRSGKMPTYIPDGREVGAVHVGDVSDCAAVLLASAEISGQVVVPTGPAPITTQDACDAIAAALGTAVVVDYRDPDHARADMAGRPSWHVEDVINICQYCSGEVNDTVPSLTRHPARPIADVAASTLAPT